MAGGVSSGEVCASAVVMLDTPCSELVWRVLATHSIRQFRLHFPYRASPCAITFQLQSKTSFDLENNLLLPRLQGTSPDRRHVALYYSEKLSIFVDVTHSPSSENAWNYTELNPDKILR